MPLSVQLSRTTTCQPVNPSTRHPVTHASPTSPPLHVSQQCPPTALSCRAWCVASSALFVPCRCTCPLQSVPHSRSRRAPGADQDPYNSRSALINSMPHASNTSQQSNSTIASSELLNPDTWSSSVDPVPPPHIFKNENHLLVDNSIYSSAPASPAISGFNFQDEDSDPPSLNRASGTQPWHNRKSRMRDGDVRPASSGVDSHPRSVRDVSKRRTRHFEDQFAYKEGWETNTADEVRRDSPVLLELRTNVIVRVLIDVLIQY